MFIPQHTNPYDTIFLNQPANPGYQPQEITKHNNDLP